MIIFLKFNFSQQKTKLKKLIMESLVETSFKIKIGNRKTREIKSYAGLFWAELSEETQSNMIANEIEKGFNF